MLKRLLKKKQKSAQRTVTVVDGRVCRRENVLVKYFPALYEIDVCVDPIVRTEMLDEAEATARELAFQMRLPLDRLPKLVRENMEALLEVPPVYHLFASLRRQEFDRFYRNNLALLTVFQCCAFYARSDRAEQVRESLMVSLLAIALRHYGISFLSKPERTLLNETREFDLGDARQKHLRDQFLKRYRAVKDKLAHVSCDRLHRLLLGNHVCPRPMFRGFLHIIRYSTRLMGRAAAEISEDEALEIHFLAGYVAQLFTFAAAWLPRRKPVPQILGELWGRARQFYHQKVYNATVTHNIQALTDLFRICRCEILPNFQNKGRDAVWSSHDKLLAREVAAYAELKPSSATSVRRYVTGPGLQGDTEVLQPLSLEDAATHAASLSSASGRKRVVVQNRWQVFRVTRAFVTQNRLLTEALENKRQADNDPSDDELEPVQIVPGTRASA